MSTTESVARCIVRLEELSDFLRGQIDGAPRPRSCKELAHHINTIEVASQLLAVQEEYAIEVRGIVKRMVSQ
jgi:hypothetical protein